MPYNGPATPAGSDPGPGRPCLPAMGGRIVCLLVVAYFIAIDLAAALSEFGGERIWPVAVLLYLPPQILLLPLIVLVPAAFLAEVPRWTLGLLAGCVIIFMIHVPFFIHIKRPVSGDALRVITNNYAQNHGYLLYPWIGVEEPDIVALQDAFGQVRNFQRAYPQDSVAAAGQFVLMSKMPIRSAILLPAPAWRGSPVAALFDVAWKGGDLAVYSIHMPSPRGDFAKLNGIGLAREMLGRNRRRSDGMSFQEAMAARVELAHGLSEVLSAEKRPYILLGDFNMPSDGYVHRIFASRFTDAFAQAGTGFGFTFPGDARNPLAFAEPWLRIDYVFTGPGWQVDDCQVEPARRSKHRAVMAVIELKK